MVFGAMLRHTCLGEEAYLATTLSDEEAAPLMAKLAFVFRPVRRLKNWVFTEHQREAATAVDDSGAADSRATIYERVRDKARFLLAVVPALSMAGRVGSSDAGIGPTDQPGIVSGRASVDVNGGGFVQADEPMAEPAGTRPVMRAQRESLSHLFSVWKGSASRSDPNNPLNMMLRELVSFFKADVELGALLDAISVRNDRAVSRQRGLAVVNTLFSSSRMRVCRYDLLAGLSDAFMIAGRNGSFAPHWLDWVHGCDVGLHRSLTREFTSLLERATEALPDADPLLQCRVLRLWALHFEARDAEFMLRSGIFERLWRLATTSHGGRTGRSGTVSPSSGEATDGAGGSSVASTSDDPAAALVSALHGVDLASIETIRTPNKVNFNEAALTALLGDEAFVFGADLGSAVARGAWSLFRALACQCVCADALELERLGGVPGTPSRGGTGGGGSGAGAGGSGGGMVPAVAASSGVNGSGFGTGGPSRLVSPTSPTAFFVPEPPSNMGELMADALFDFVFEWLAEAVREASPDSNDGSGSVSGGATAKEKEEENDQLAQAIVLPVGPARVLNDDFELHTYNGGVQAGSPRRYMVENVLRDNDAVHCSAPGCGWDLVLRFARPMRFILTGVRVVAPSGNYTAPIKDGLVWVSEDEPVPSAYSGAFDGAAGMASAREPAPVAYFLCPSRQETTVELERPAVGRYVHIKFLSTYGDQNNVDVRYIELLGHEAPQFGFGPVESSTTRLVGVLALLSSVSSAPAVQSYCRDHLGLFLATLARPGIALEVKQIVVRILRRVLADEDPGVVVRLVESSVGGDEDSGVGATEITGKIAAADGCPVIDLPVVPDSYLGPNASGGESTTLLGAFFSIAVAALRREREANERAWAGVAAMPGATLETAEENRNLAIEMCMLLRFLLESPAWSAVVGAQLRGVMLRLPTLVRTQVGGNGSAEPNGSDGADGSQSALLLEALIAFYVVGGAPKVIRIGSCIESETESPVVVARDGSGVTLGVLDSNGVPNYKAAYLSELVPVADVGVAVAAFPLDPPLMPVFRALLGSSDLDAELFFDVKAAGVRALHELLANPASASCFIETGTAPLLLSNALAPTHVSFRVSETHLIKRIESLQQRLCARTSVEARLSLGASAASVQVYDDVEWIQSFCVGHALALGVVHEFLDVFESLGISATDDYVPLAVIEASDLFAPLPQVRVPWLCVR